MSTKILREIADLINAHLEEEEAVEATAYNRGVAERVQMGVTAEPGDIITKMDTGEKFLVVTTPTYLRCNAQYGRAGRNHNDLPVGLPYLPMFNIGSRKARWTRQFARYQKDGRPITGFAE